MRQYVQRYYPESSFGGFTDVDGTIRFYVRVNALLRAETVVLDIGCGRGPQRDDPVKFRRQLRDLRGKCKRVIGIDIDTQAACNPFLSEFRLIAGERWPIADATIGVAVCDYVMEHIADPDAFTQELFRVLEPRGYACLRTPNVRSYFGLVSRLVPNRLHARLAAALQDGREAPDVFPTLYRCNTPSALRSLLSRYGFRHCVYTMEAEPSYHSRNGLIYLLGVLHQRYAPAPLRLNIFAFAQKVR